MPQFPFFVNESEPKNFPENGRPRADGFVCAGRARPQADRVCERAGSEERE
jgi:hypothetical protein